MSSFFPSLESFVKGTAATAAGIGTLGVGLLYYGQNYLIYPSAFPQGSREQVAVPSEFGLPYTDLTLTAPDGVKLKVYLLTQRRHLDIHGATPMPWSLEDDGDEESFIRSRPTVLMFHGNGGNHGHRIPLARIFYLKMRCNVLMLSYRGYGLSEGTPSEKGLQMDAQTTLNYALRDPQFSTSPKILYGQSIGGAVAIDLASKNPSAIRALVLENTFTSLPRLIPTAMPFLSPFAWLCHQKWESYLKIPTLPKHIPVLMLGGVHDEVVPRAHMHDLWALFRARGSPNQPTLSVPGATAKSASSSVGEKFKDSSEKVTSFVVGRANAARNPTQVSTPDGTSREITAVTAESPPPVNESDGSDRFMEFGAGTHNDTCVQPGYWLAITKFVESLDGVKLAKSDL